MERFQVTDAEKLRKFCERVKLAHPVDDLCLDHPDFGGPCDALKAVRALEEMLAYVEPERTQHGSLRAEAISLAAAKVENK